MLGIQQRDSVATLSVGTNSATYSFLANSPLVNQIVLQNDSATRMTTTKTYDYLNQLTQIASTPAASPVISFAYAYNKANQRTSVTNADGTYRLSGYDAVGQVTSGVKYFNNGAPVPGEQFGYAFDNIGNRTSTTAGGDQNGGNLRTATYGANLNNQYTNRTVPGAVEILGSAVTNATVTVNNQATYRNGMFYEATLGLTNTGAAVWEGVTNVALAHSNSRTDLVATVTGNVFVPQTPETFSYDADGNLTQDGRWTYTWDGENRLIQMVSLTNAPTASKLRLTFGYDSKCRRISKVVEGYNGTSWTTNLAEGFVFDGWNILDELNATNNALIRSYLWGLDLSRSLQGAGGVGGLIVVEQAGGVPGEFAAFDGNGNVAGYISASNGTTPSRLEYGPFGERVNESDRTMAFGFSSKYGDAESDLVYYGYRFYEASTGKWLKRDPMNENGGLNLFAFVNNDPNHRVDSFGLEEFPYPDPDGRPGGSLLPDGTAGTISISLSGNQLCRGSVDGQVILSLAIRVRLAADDMGQILAQTPVFIVNDTGVTLPISTPKDKDGAITASGSVILATARCPNGPQQESGVILIRDFSRRGDRSRPFGPTNPGIITMRFTYQYNYECPSQVKICSCYAKSPFRYNVHQTCSVVTYPGLTQ